MPRKPQRNRTKRTSQELAQELMTFRQSPLQAGGGHHRDICRPCRKEAVDPKPPDRALRAKNTRVTRDPRARHVQPEKNDMHE